MTSDPIRESITARLVDDAPRRRRLAVATVVPDRPEAIFALRSVLARDEDATVRARAAERLRAAEPRALAPCRAAVEDALADALRDPAPLVREAAARAAGALRAVRAVVALCDALRCDPAWKVRRSAARSLARIADGAPAAALEGALDDPFWRVRYAAIQALAELPEGMWNADSVCRGSARQVAALAYLDAIRSGRIDAEAAPPEPELVDADSPDAAFGDEDPAVVAARLVAAPPGACERALLIAALASPHASLRRAAVHVLGARGRIDEIAGALAWLDEPRVPYAAGAARRLLARTGSRELADHVLADAGAGPGARAWALEEAARLGLDAEGGAARGAVSDPQPSVRLAAFRALARLGDEGAILAALADPDEATRAEVVGMLAPVLEDPAVRAALDPVAASAVDPGVRSGEAGVLGAAPGAPAARVMLAPVAAGVVEPGPPEGLFVARALLEVVRRWLGKPKGAACAGWIDALLRRATSAPWADVRAEAVALRAHRGALDPGEREALTSDPDPWVREAAMDGLHAARALAEDPDPFVRRAAARVALAPLRAAHARPSHPGARRKGRGRTLPEGGSEPRELPAVAVLAARSEDAWIRAAAASALDVRAAGGLALLLRLTRDVAPMVRAAAAEAIEGAGDVTAECMQIVHAPDTPEELLLAAHARLLAAPSAEGLAALDVALASRELSAAGRAALGATALVYPEELRGEGATRGESATRVGEGAARGESATRVGEGAARGESATRVEEGAARVEEGATRVEEGATPVGPALRPLGKTGILVAPLGLSGAGEISPAALEAARGAGVNLFFWEPRYRALTDFASRAARRHELVMVAGSYEADARSIERDVERALRRLRIDALGVMLLFWVRSRARLEEGAFEALLRLKQQGKVRAIGFSTHLRDLAEQAISARSWDVVMCRLSAAHPGAERSLLPAAAARGVGVIAFSALCYGRLLASPSPGAIASSGANPSSGVTAADCYRYSLAQPGVSVCLSAPRRWRELAENLKVLERPELDPGEIERLRAHGAQVHTANRTFVRLVHGL